MPKTDDKEREAYTVRLSARTTRINFTKLVAVAKAKGWMNSKGQPNISKVLNHIIGRFRVPKEKKPNGG
jgi:hypothetical protein